MPPEVCAATETALKKLERLGAILVDPADPPSIEEFWEDHSRDIIWKFEFKEGIEQYLAALSESNVRSLEDIIRKVSSCTPAPLIISLLTPFNLQV